MHLVHPLPCSKRFCEPQLNVCWQAKGWLTPSFGVSPKPNYILTSKVAHMHIHDKDQNYISSKGNTAGSTALDEEHTVHEKLDCLKS